VLPSIFIVSKEGPVPPGFAITSVPPPDPVSTVIDKGVEKYYLEG
jgi:hypothetical protein